MNDPKLFDNKEETINFSETIPDQFIVTETELDQDVYEQFLAELEWLEPQPDYAMLLRQGKALCGDMLPLSQKKTILVQLACRGTMEAYQLLQQYCTCPDSVLEQWSGIALYECRMHLESELLGEFSGLISSGLGGDGERVRYIFVLALQGECPTEEQRQEVQRVLDRGGRQHRSRVEQVQFHSSCLSVQILVPIDVAVGEVIETSIARLNRKDEQVWPDYLVTNVAVPTEEEIQDFLNGLQ